MKRKKKVISFALAFCMLIASLTLILIDANATTQGNYVGFCGEKSIDTTNGTGGTESPVCYNRR